MSRLSDLLWDYLAPDSNGFDVHPASSSVPSLLHPTRSSALSLHHDLHSGVLHSSSAGTYHAGAHQHYHPTSFQYMTCPGNTICVSKIGDFGLAHDMPEPYTPGSVPDAYTPQYKEDKTQIMRGGTPRGQSQESKGAEYEDENLNDPENYSYPFKNKIGKADLRPANDRETAKHVPTEYVYEEMCPIKGVLKEGGVELRNHQICLPPGKGIYAGIPDDCDKNCFGWSRAGFEKNMCKAGGLVDNCGCLPLDETIGYNPIPKMETLEIQSGQKHMNFLQQSGNVGSTVGYWPVQALPKGKFSSPYSMSAVTNPGRQDPEVSFQDDIYIIRHFPFLNIDDKWIGKDVKGIARWNNGVDRNLFAADRLPLSPYKWRYLWTKHFEGGVRWNTMYAKMWDQLSTIMGKAKCFAPKDIDVGADCLHTLEIAKQLQKTCIAMNRSYHTLKASLVPTELGGKEVDKKFASSVQPSCFENSHIAYQEDRNGEKKLIDVPSFRDIIATHFEGKWDALKKKPGWWVMDGFNIGAGEGGVPTQASVKAKIED